MCDDICTTSKVSSFRLICRFYKYLYVLAVLYHEEQCHNDNSPDFLNRKPNFRVSCLGVTKITESTREISVGTSNISNKGSSRESQEDLDVLGIFLSRATKLMVHQNGSTGLKEEEIIDFVFKLVLEIWRIKGYRILE